MHARDGHAQHAGGEDQRRPAAAPAGEPERQARGRDADGDAGDDIGQGMIEMGAGMERRHADVVHGGDAGAHEDRGRGEAERRRRRAGRPGANGEDRDSHHDDADQEGEQGREDQEIDGEGQARRQHADEMHGPDGDGQRDGGPRQQQAPAQPLRPPDLDCQAQADIGPLDRHDQGEHDEPWLMRYRHCQIAL